MNVYSNTPLDEKEQKIELNKLKLIIGRPYFIIVTCLCTLLVIVCLGIVIIDKLVDFKYSCTESLYNKNEQQTDINNIIQLRELNEKYIKNNTYVRSAQIENFNLKINKFIIQNEGSYNSTDGMCAGFSMYEKLNYLDKLKDIKVKETTIDIEPKNEHSIASFKPIGEDTYIINSKFNIINDRGRKQNIGADILYKIHTGYYKDELYNYKDDLKNKELANVLNIVNYLQREVNKDFETYPRTMIEPYKYISIKQIREIKKRKDIIKDIDIDLITKQIDNNEPALIGLYNDLGGHALLAYKYEYINDNTVKLYVSDSNIVLKEDSQGSFLKDGLIYYNQDVENIYVLLVRDNEDSNWGYIYNPSLNGNKAYSKEYNSYIPGTYMQIFHPIK